MSKRAVHLLRVGGFNLADLKKGSEFILRKFPLSSMYAAAFNIPSGAGDGGRETLLQKVLLREFAEGKNKYKSFKDTTVRFDAKRKEEWPYKKKNELSDKFKSLMEAFRVERGAESHKSKKDLALARIRAEWDDDSYKLEGSAARVGSNKTGAKISLLTESDRHATATILHKLNQKYVGRDRIDTDDSLRSIGYRDGGFEGKVRPYFFEKFRRDPIYADRLFYLLTSIFAREGKLVRMRKIFNEIARRSKYNFAETFNTTANTILREMRPEYANYLHTKGRSREIMPRPITFHQAASLSLRFFKRKVMSKDSRNAALKSIKAALINEIDNYFAEYKTRNTFFESYVEQSKQNIYLVAGFKAARDRLENERMKEYQISAGLVAKDREKGEDRRTVSAKIVERRKLYFTRWGQVRQKLNMKSTDIHSVAEMVAFDDELARKRGQMRIGKRGVRQTKKNASV